MLTHFRPGSSPGNTGVNGVSILCNKSCRMICHLGPLLSVVYDDRSLNTSASAALLPTAWSVLHVTPDKFEYLLRLLSIPSGSQFFIKCNPSKLAVTVMFTAITIAAWNYFHLLLLLCN